MADDKFDRKERKKNLKNSFSKKVNHYSEEENSPIMRPKMILMKQPIKADSGTSDTPEKSVSPVPLPLVIQPRKPPENDTKIPKVPENGIVRDQQYVIQKSPAPPVHKDINELKSKLALPPLMKESVKLLDLNLFWCDEATDFMTDNSDFLVVGVLGYQGCGKSTILSLLSGNDYLDGYRSYVFRPQNSDSRIYAYNKTGGIDAFVTPSRLVFLDTQPIMSPGVLNSIIRLEKKGGHEKQSYENAHELMSLQLASFLLSTCHVVLVVMDWFVDPQLIRLLQTAAMMTPASLVYNTPGKEQLADIVFVLNKAKGDDLHPRRVDEMKLVLDALMKESGLNYKSRGSSTQFPNHLVYGGKETIEQGHEAKASNQDVSLYVIPSTNRRELRVNTASGQSQAAAFHFTPTFDQLIAHLRRNILKLPRQNALTERNWLQLASKAWDGTKHSKLFADYSQLLT